MNKPRKENQTGLGGRRGGGDTAPILGLKTSPYEAGKNQNSDRT